ncbi:MAG: ABC transporter substrate-binding protein [Bacteroidetes bacterium]|nr:ABC transporter substrate-binding protein [Bacteroidota bacterium]
MNKIHSFHPLLNWLLPILIFTCCGSPGKKDGTAITGEKPRKVFRYNEAAGISSLDPAFARNVENIWAVNQVFNGLVQMDEKLNIVPCIAQTWKITEYGLKYTFHLRNDVYFQDHEKFDGGKGRKVTAADFKHSFFRITDPEVASPGAWIFNNLDRSKGFSGFDSPDDSTFILWLQKPFAPFLGLLTTQYCSVVPHEIVEFYGKDFRNHPVGTGPFRFKQWEEGVKLILVKNENYFEKSDGQQLPRFNAISVAFLSDPHAAFLEFLKGELDFLSGLEPGYKDLVLTKNGELNPEFNGKFIMQGEPYLKTDYIGILVDESMDIVKKSPLQNKLVRQAINYGINRVDIVRFLRNNVGTPGISGFIPAGLPSFDSTRVRGYNYNPEKARTLLAEAGFENGDGLPETVLTTTSAFLDVLEYVQYQLGEIGIKIKIEVVPAATHREMVARGNVNFFRKTWVADYPDAENFLACFYSKNFSPAGPNYTHFHNENFDRLYEKSQSELLDSVRFGYYRQMDQIIMDEAPVVVLYYDRIVRLVQNNISGITCNPMNLLTLKKADKK